MPEFIPTEAEEARTLVAWLLLQGLMFHHSPNETGHSLEARRRAVRVKREGTSKGFPDYVILLPPGRSKDGRGYVFVPELKRCKQSASTLSPEQKAWIDAFNDLGVDQVRSWRANGAQEVIDAIQPLIRPGTTPSPF